MNHDNLTSTFATIDSFIDGGQLHEAQELLSKLQSSHDHLPQVYIGLARLHDKKGAHELALQSFTQAFERGPQLFPLDSHLNLARTHRDRGALSKAISICEGVLENLKENDGGALDLLGDLYQRVGQFSYAVHCFERVLESKEKIDLVSNTEHPDFRYISKITNIYEELHRLGDALSCLEGRLGQVPLKVCRVLSKVKLLAADGYIGDAINHIEEYESQNGITAETKFTLGVLYLTLASIPENSSLFSAARHQIAQALECDPTWGSGYCYLAIASRSDASLTQSERDPNSIRVLLEKAINLDPSCELAFAEIWSLLYGIGQIELGFPYMERAVQLQNKRIERHPLGKIGVRFFYNLFYAMGHGCDSPDLTVKLEKLGWTKPANYFVFVPAGRSANAALVDYWKQYFHVISDLASIKELLPLARALHYRISYPTLQNGKVLHQRFAKSLIQQEWEKQKRSPVLSLSEEHRRKGAKLLRELGMPEGAWFVGIHVRDGSYKKEGQSLFNKHRNANIASYSLAVEAITSRGGWIVHMGEGPSPVIADMPNVINYVQSTDRCDWMDLYICAQSKFFLSTSAGVLAAPQILGTPVVITNLPATPCQHDGSDLALPKLIWKESESRFLTFKEMFSPPVFQAESGEMFRDLGLAFIDNSAEDILGVTLEMIERFDGTLTYSSEDEKLQQRYRSLFPPAFGVILPRIGREFLNKYKALLE